MTIDACSFVSKAGPHEAIQAIGAHRVDDTDAIYSIVASCFGSARERLTPDTSLVDDLGIDSIDLLALGVELEEEYDVVISNEALCRIRTVRDVVLCMAGAREVRRPDAPGVSVRTTS
jgi:acyl carrier protein